MVSICMLAMAHGSNEINVAAPLSAEIFLLDGQDEQIQREHEFISIAVGILLDLTFNFNRRRTTVVRAI